MLNGRNADDCVEGPVLEIAVTQVAKNVGNPIVPETMLLRREGHDC